MAWTLTALVFASISLRMDFISFMSNAVTSSISNSSTGAFAGA